ncbi:hypothetical protein M758_2G017400 [Ceratodon purpureus]|uniref:Uncharacterized protein n=1 Tax=Ceratodon purpureus TaxID=3225 RepID=A0A8T0IQR2_CERPU|nr:hypothetical protein KC19_2G018300 [Ceratodon purpureus]KAG0624969.1 hypothetical protein M758_2G017400 [Ceratodon purpureus]
MYISLYLIAFDWMEHGYPVKLDRRGYHRISNSHFFRSMVMAAPGYVIRQLATLDEIRLATDMCVHFDHQKHCRTPRAPPAPPAPPEPPVIICEVQPKPRRRRSRSRPRGRTRSRSKLRFGIEQCSIQQNNLYSMLQCLMNRSQVEVDHVGITVFWCRVV